MTPLDDLIARLEAFDASADHAVSSRLGWDVWEYLDIGNGKVSDYLRSLDAVTALIEDRLPGCWWEVGFVGADAHARLTCGTHVRSRAKTAPCALLAVTLRALEAKEKT